LIELFAPNKRKYDVANREKGLMDSLVHAGVMGDDEQIDDIRIVRSVIVPGGLCRVKIESM
jgi:crossover junction endodeoxyribonuclease RusA